ncbi:MAG: hypothetical protein ACYCY1_09300 [Sulfuriferula sp.]
MRLDPIVTRRFHELQQKADSVIAAKKLDYITNDGSQYYKVPSDLYKEWATNVLSLLQRTFGENSIHYQNFSAHYTMFDGWESNFLDSQAIFKAAREDYEGGYLFNIKTLAKAEILADAIDQAKELLHAGYKDPACILARVSLESTLKDLAEKFGVTEGSLDRMNADLCKAGAYNMAKQKQITAWAEIGNKAAHGDWGKYTDQDATAMVSGVEMLVADL